MSGVPGGPVGCGGGRGAAALPGLAALLAAAAIVATAASCGGDSAGGEDGGRTAASAGDTATAAGPDTAADADSAPAPDPRPLRAFRFRIRNEGGDTVVIFADAGAGERTLDTVPPADSGEVRVETRAPLLELRARSGSGGAVLVRSRYDLERPAGDTLLEFPVASVTAQPDTAGG